MYRGMYFLQLLLWAKSKWNWQARRFLHRYKWNILEECQSFFPGCRNTCCQTTRTEQIQRSFTVKTYKPNIKGTVSRDGYFFEGLNILISSFCVCAEGFQDLSQSFHYHLALLLVLKMLTETFLRLSLSVTVRCSLVPTSHWLQGKCARITRHRQLPVLFYRITGGFL